MGADYKFSKNPPLLGGCAANLSVAGADEYISVCGNYAATGTIVNVELVCQYAGVISHMTSYLSVAPGGVTTRTFTLYVNGAPTALTTTFVGASQYETDDVNNVAVQRGDLIVWHSDGGVGAVAAARVKISCKYTRI